jgi:hypothetical protein
MSKNGSMNHEPGPGELPEQLRRRPFDPKRGLPIPAMNLPPGDLDPDHADFTAIFGETVYHLAKAEKCGICTEPLGYWMAFIGGPKSFANRAYVDPPLCLGCAEYAMTHCPHMAIRRHRRVPDARLQDGVHVPDGFDASKPETLVMGITRGFTITADQSGSMYFKAAPFKRHRTYTYDESGDIVEVLA